MNGHFDFITVRSLSQAFLKKPTLVGFFHVVRGLRVTKALRIIAIATIDAIAIVGLSLQSTN
ncbi:hypothetical protein GNF10_04195 [Nostoc sp. UCD121]|uniref:hypothetical protein n=1 Tax=unclassified Nostoc TaxID=2593658 RepID=UPI001627421F|nr:MULTISPECIES: hypothetical protein [unclassified Nostoc]MBC1222394.1 hypothetical protein [Nostoc sp. UCD120]MBC1275204.1 hypothetical protein [Nostoc sp. UCD121]MBC1294114.1 hypothetical protein [Nostoc sp. UCD122]